MLIIRLVLLYQIISSVLQDDLKRRMLFCREEAREREREASASFSVV